MNKNCKNSPGHKPTQENRLFLFFGCFGKSSNCSPWNSVFSRKKEANPSVETQWMVSWVSSQVFSVSFSESEVLGVWALGNAEGQKFSNKKVCECQDVWCHFSFSGELGSKVMKEINICWEAYIYWIYCICNPEGIDNMATPLTINKSLKN